MQRGTRATCEGGGEGERGDGREVESGLRLVVKNALLVTTAIWVLVFLCFVCLDRVIPVQCLVITFPTFSLVRRVVSLSKGIFRKGIS